MAKLIFVFALLSVCQGFGKIIFNLHGKLIEIPLTQERHSTSFVNTPRPPPQPENPTPEHWFKVPTEVSDTMTKMVENANTSDDTSSSNAKGTYASASSNSKSPGSAPSSSYGRKGDSPSGAKGQGPASSPDSSTSASNNRLGPKNFYENAEIKLTKGSSLWGSK